MRRRVSDHLCVNKKGLTILKIKGESPSRNQGRFKTAQRHHSTIKIDIQESMLLHINLQACLNQTNTITTKWGALLNILGTASNTDMSKPIQIQTIIKASILQVIASTRTDNLFRITATEEGDPPDILMAAIMR